MLTEISLTPPSVVAGKIFLPLLIAGVCTPNILGMDGPVTSASSIAALSPLFAAADASIAETDDLPTPPLPLTTPMTFFMLPCSAFCGRERDAQSSPHDAQL